MTTKLLRWAQTEKEAAELQAQGWRLTEQRISHHHRFAILLEKAEPVESDEQEIDAIK